MLDLMTRGLLRSTDEIFSGLRSLGKSNIKTHFPSMFVDFCRVSPLIDGSDLIRDFETSTLQDFDTSLLKLLKSISVNP
jgi:hypothetical protein